MKKKQKNESKSNSKDMFKYFNEEWNTESPSDDDKGTTISDDDGYVDGIDERPTPKKQEYIDDDYDY